MSNKKWALVIHRIEDGGYNITDYHPRALGMAEMVVFACSTIDEALQYIEKNLTDLTRPDWDHG